MFAVASTLTLIPQLCSNLQRACYKAGTRSASIQMESSPSTQAAAGWANTKAKRAQRIERVMGSGIGLDGRRVRGRRTRLGFSVGDRGTQFPRAKHKTITKP